MEESFKYIKDLIDAERYKDYKTEYWGGCDVVIVSKNEYKRKQKTLNDVNFISFTSENFLLL